ncbi:MAG: hypothetical protein QOD72_464, partial [Acidimicrobiaceae bacterium]|nr:hypothetical protein [Acidimicrobiaceae bacterium]
MVVAGATFVTLLGAAGFGSAVSKTFPANRVGVVYGWVFAAHQLGAAVAAYTAGSIRSATGSYDIAIHLAGM